MQDSSGNSNTTELENTQSICKTYAEKERVKKFVETLIQIDKEIKQDARKSD